MILKYGSAFGGSGHDGFGNLQFRGVDLVVKTCQRDAQLLLVRLVSLTEVLRETQHDIGNSGRHGRERKSFFVLLAPMLLEHRVKLIGDNASSGNLRKHGKRALLAKLIHKLSGVHGVASLPKSATASSR